MNGMVFRQMAGRRTAEFNLGLVRVGCALLLLAAHEFWGNGAHLLLIVAYLGWSSIVMVWLASWRDTFFDRQLLCNLVDVVAIGALLILWGDPAVLFVLMILMLATAYAAETPQYLKFSLAMQAAAYTCSLLAAAPIHGAGWSAMLGSILLLGGIVTLSLGAQQRRDALHQHSGTRSTIAPAAAESRPVEQQRLLLLPGQGRTTREVVYTLNRWSRKVTSVEFPLDWIGAAINDAPDCAIFDQRGRTEDPIEVVRVLRSDPRAKRIRTILITDDPDAPDQMRSLHQAGFDSVITTPLDNTLLFNALQQRLSANDARDDRVLSLMDHYIRGRSRLQPMSILLAVNGGIQDTVIREILQKAEHRVLVAGTGEQALAAIGNHRFDAAIFDARLPDLDAFELIRLARASHRTKRQPALPILILSNDTTPAYREQFRASGANLLLAKPVQPSRLLRALGEATAPERRSGTLSFTTRSTDMAGPYHQEVIDRHTLEELEKLGHGLPFLSRLIDNFLSDTEILLGDMRHHAEHRLRRQYRDDAHALRGSAGSVGASRLVALADQIMRLSTDEFDVRAAVINEQIDSTLRVTRDALLAHIEERRLSISKN